MKCPFCGKEIPDDSKFCPGCGQPIPQELDNSNEEHVDQSFDDPAHEITYSGAFSQQVSGPNQTTKINMQGGASYVQQLDPNRAYKGMIASLSTAIVFAILGLVFGLLAKNPANSKETLFFILPLVGAFAGLFLGLIGYLAVQFKLFKMKKPDSVKDWIPTALFVIDLAVTIPALIFALQAFGKLLE